MDWIAKYEQERRDHENAERQRLQERRERVDHFRVVADRLSPLLADALGQIESRAGISLKLDVSETSLTVSTVRTNKKPFSYIDDNRFTISEPSPDYSTVQVVLVDDNRIDRPGEIPDDMSPADWSGTADTVLNVRTDLNALVSGEIHLLLEWLVEKKARKKTPAVPQIAGQRRQEFERRQAVESLGRAKACAYLGLACGIIGFFFPPVGPLALWLGRAALRGIPGSSYSEARTSAEWAVGLGIWSSACLFIILVMFVIYIAQR